MVAVSVGLIVGAFQLSGAGSLTPPAAPAGTMNEIEEVYDALVGDFDSSAVVASRNGNVLEISKCIIDKINGSPCP
jgi:hypothetical protein